MPADLVPRLVEAADEAERRRVIESNRAWLATDEALTLLKNESRRSRGFEVSRDKLCRIHDFKLR